jgi:hypothetical protein
MFSFRTSLDVANLNQTARHLTTLGRASGGGLSIQGFRDVWRILDH